MYGAFFFLLEAGQYIVNIFTKKICLGRKYSYYDRIRCHKIVFVIMCGMYKRLAVGREWCEAVFPQ